MLNEYIEYEEYMQWPTTTPRIFTHKKYAMTKTKLSGLERPLIIIARKILFDDLKYCELTTEDARAQALKSTIDALKAWTAFGEVPNIAGLNDFRSEWFKDFFQESFDLDAWNDLISGKKSKASGKLQFEESLLPKKINAEGKEDSQANTYKLITYERIIADAIYQGPLQRKYLVCKSGFESDIIYRVYSRVEKEDKKEIVLDHTEYLANCKKSLTSKRLEKIFYSDLVLRYIAAYLMERNRCGQENVILNKTDLYNWIQALLPFKYDKTKFVYSAFEYNPRKDLEDTEYLFSSEAYDNVSKSLVNQDYLKKYDFRVVDEDEISKLSDGYVYFSDQGAGLPLSKNTRYK